MLSKSKIENLIEWFSVFYVFISLNPFLLWIVNPVLINVTSSAGMLMALLYMFSCKKVKLSGSRIIILIGLLLFTAHISTSIFLKENNLGKLINFISLATLILYPARNLISIFLKFKKLLYFFCVVSLVVFVIILLGFDLPYYKIPGFSVVMESLGAYYKLYGVIVSSTNTIYNFGGLTIMRICGPFLEPGHFAIYIGFVLMLEKIMFNKLNKILLITAILTFSPSIFFFLITILLYHNLSGGSKKRGFLGYIAFALLIGVVYLGVGTEARENISFLIVGRNFENTGFDLAGVLDGRAGKEALHAYRYFAQTPEVYFGKGVKFLEGYGVLSDYRGFIFKFGYIGITLSILFYSFIILSIDKKSKVISFLLIALIILLHRSWMFESPFIYFATFLATIKYKDIHKYVEKNSN